MTKCLIANQETFLKKDPKLQGIGKSIAKYEELYIEAVIREQYGHYLVELGYGAGLWWIYPSHWVGLRTPLPEKAIAMIKAEEGFSSEAYPDPTHEWQVPTIGYGTTRYPNGEPVKQGDKLPEHVAEAYLMWYLEQTLLPGLRRIPTFSQLNEHQLIAIASFGYNCGAYFYASKGFAAITKLLDQPAKWSDCKYVHSTFGKYTNGGLEGLVERRKAEAAMFCGSNEHGFSLLDAIVTYCKEAGYELDTRPGHVNIVYVEGMNLDGSLNNDAPNVFNDLRLVLIGQGAGTVAISGKWEATTEPGDYYTYNKLNPKGAARIAFGQYDAWQVGMHGKGRNAHEALVQTGGPVTVHRDLNKDFIRTGDELDTGYFGINQHHGYNNAYGNVGRASAGCLVGRTIAGHRQFMQLVKSDPRYSKNKSLVYSTIIIPGDAIQKVS